jgi:WD40 repeat protein
MVFQTTKRESSHDDSAWSVVWTADDRIVSGSIDETVKVHSISYNVIILDSFLMLMQVWKPIGDIESKPPTLEFWDLYKDHFLGVVSMSASA